MVMTLMRLDEAAGEIPRRGLSLRPEVAVAVTIAGIILVLGASILRANDEPPQDHVFVVHGPDGSRKHVVSAAL